MSSSLVSARLWVSQCGSGRQTPHVSGAGTRIKGAIKASQRSAPTWQARFVTGQNAGPWGTRLQLMQPEPGEWAAVGAGNGRAWDAAARRPRLCGTGMAPRDAALMPPEARDAAADAAPGAAGMPQGQRMGPGPARAQPRPPGRARHCRRGHGKIPATATQLLPLCRTRTPCNSEHH